MGTHWELERNTLEEHIGNLMGTRWEQMGTWKKKAGKGGGGGGREMGNSRLAGYTESIKRAVIM
jgi:hypothetical protein